MHTTGIVGVDGCKVLSMIWIQLVKTGGLFFATALAEIVGCYLPYLWLKKGGSPWLVVPAAMSLTVFVWLLTLHPGESGRVYAAYGSVYVVTALLWLRLVQQSALSLYDLIGGILALSGMVIIAFGWGK